MKCCELRGGTFGGREHFIVHIGGAQYLSGPYLTLEVLVRTPNLSRNKFKIACAYCKKDGRMATLPLLIFAIALDR